MSDEMKPKKRTANDIVRVYTKLQEVCVRLAEPDEAGKPRCAYHPGWDDERVAAEAGLTVNQVRALRQQMFGNTRLRHAAEPRDKHFTEKVEAHERQLEILEARVDALASDMSRVHAAIAAKLEKHEIVFARLEQEIGEKIRYVTDKYDRFKEAVNRRLNGN